MKKVAWITPSYFVETDIYIIPLLLTQYSIEWYIYVTNNEQLRYKDEIARLQEHERINIHIIHINGRQRSLSTLKGLYRMLQEARKSKPDMVYTAMTGYPYFTPLVYLTFGAKKTVIAAHNVTTPKGSSNYRLAQIYTWFTLRFFKNFQTFSINQYNLLNEQYKGKNTYYAPFILKDYGAPTTTPDDVTTFLSFGYIRNYKRIDVLIAAAEKVHQETDIPFRIIIAGKCEDWENYEKLIKTPSLYELHIRSIDNEEIPGLFGRSHYFVAPYQDIAQSGSLIVGINYEKPIIASDLESFREYIHHEENGYLMQPASVDDLSRIMKNIITNHRDIYPRLHNEMMRIKETEFNKESIAQRYITFFDKIICR